MNTTTETETPSLSTTIALWNKWKDRTKQAQELERKIRQTIVDVSFHGSSLKEGANTKKIELADTQTEIKLTVTNPINRKIDTDKLMVAYDTLVSEFGEDTAQAWFNGLFEYKPNLNLKNYRMLQASKDEDSVRIRNIVNEAITSQEGMPALKIVPVKAKK